MHQFCKLENSERYRTGAPTKGEGMDTLRIAMSNSDNEGFVYNRTEKNVEDNLITWQDAADAFFYALRGHGYIIVPEDYAAYVASTMKELVEAESGSNPVKLSLPLDEI